MVEKLIFNLFAFTFFILMFLNLIRKNDTNYTYILAMQALGIFVNFLELMFEIKLAIAVKILIYILSIVLPIVVIVIEYKRNISITELINIIKAEICIRTDKYQQAERYLINITNRYPRNKQAHEKLGILYEKENKIEEAIREFEISINEEYNEKIYIKIGSLYEKNKKHEQAKTIFEEIIKENPESYEASMKLADVLYNMNEFKYAIQIYNTILKYYPNDYDIYYALGMTYTMLNDFQKAKENYNKAAQINSLSYHAKYSLGQLSLICEDLDEAIQYFEECLDAEEVDAKAYYYLARIAIIKGEREKAINYSNVAIEIDDRLYDKIQKDNIFITIRDKINKPDRTKKVERKEASIKEQQVEEHLEKMTKIVGKLKNDDIQMIENVMRSRQDEEKER